MFILDLEYAPSMKPHSISRRRFFQLVGLTALTLIHSSRAGRVWAQADWRSLLIHYRNGALNNYWEENGRRAILASRLYPGIYIRDGLFWGPLGLEDADFGWDCYRWFAESQMENGQIKSVVALMPEQADALQTHDDEGSLLFVLASDWLARARRKIESERVVRAYEFVQTHVVDDLYLSPPGAFRYWLDTMQLDVSDSLAHNQGLLCLARRAMVNLGLADVNEGNVAAAQRAYRSFFDAASGYLTCGKSSRFATAQDVSALFPEFLSRYLYGEPILSDAMVLAHVNRILGNASVLSLNGTLAGIKVLSSRSGAFLPPAWFLVPGLNREGNYHNGAHWSLYSIVMLALAYQITRSEMYARRIGELVWNELAADPHSKEFIVLTPGAVGTFDPLRSDYTWNALIPIACRWCGLTS